MTKDNKKSVLQAAINYELLCNLYATLEVLLKMEKIQDGPLFNESRAWDWNEDTTDDERKQVLRKLNYKI